MKIKESQLSPHIVTLEIAIKIQKSTTTDRPEYNTTKDSCWASFQFPLQPTYCFRCRLAFSGAHECTPARELAVRGGATVARPGKDSDSDVAGASRQNIEATKPKAIMVVGLQHFSIK